MKSLDQLRQIADETLSGLEAGPDMYARIMNSAGKKKRFTFSRRRVLALSLSLSIAAAVGFVLLPALRGMNDGMQQINTQAAGALPDTARMTALDVPRGSIKLVDTGKTPGYMGVWAKSQGANFPMIRVDGRYYRLLTNPTNAGDTLLGGSLGQVGEKTDEPALSSAAIVSNVADQGSTVHEVASMRGAAVIAPVEGVMRVFQRVSFSGNALIGSESLASTLGSGAVTALQLSGAGTVTDSAKLQELMGILYARAAYQGSNSRTTDQALLIQYNNGLVLQMAVKGDNLIACGTWACPEFFEAFAAAVP